MGRVDSGNELPTIAEVEAALRQADRDLDAAESALRLAELERNNLYIALCKARYGVDRGTVVWVTRHGKPAVEAIVDHIPLGYTSHGRPWLMVRLKTKTGYSGSIIHAYDNWEVLDGEA